MSVVAAAVALDNASTNWSVQMNFKQARSFAHSRDVKYTFSLGNIIEKLESVMFDTYCIFTVGRESSRVLYLEGYFSAAQKAVLRPLVTFSDEFDITVDANTEWTKLRMWWD